MIIAPAVGLRALDLDLFLLSPWLGCFRQRDAEYTVLEARLDLVRIHSIRHAEGAMEIAEMALRYEVILPSVLGFFVLFSFDRQRAIHEPLQPASRSLPATRL